MNIKERFTDFKNPNYFSRADRNHILDLHIGLDEKGRKSIELRAKFSPRKIKGSTAIEVNQYRRADYNTLRFSLIDDNLSGLFYKFCEDIIEQTRTVPDKSEGYAAIINRFHLWRKMFVPGKKVVMSESSIMGLIGEIMFMRGPLADRIGLSQALKSWSGQELTHKDFSYGDTWSEVKSISKSSTAVRISSLEQLDSDKNGELVVYPLEKMSEKYDGLTLNKIVVETMKMFSDVTERDLFLTKVAMQGYDYNDYYDYFVYAADQFRTYSVTSDFPKLTKANISNAIIKAEYQIALNEIKDFEIK